MKLSVKVGMDFFKEETVLEPLCPPQTSHKYCD